MAVSADEQIYPESGRHQTRSASGAAKKFLARWPGGVVWFITAICCMLPLFWMLGTLATEEHAWDALKPFGFHAALLGRTLLYNGVVALLAMLISLPVASVIGRGRGVKLAVVTFVLPAALLLPSIVYSYGWMQVLRLGDDFFLHHQSFAQLLHHLGIGHIPDETIGIVRLYPSPASAGDVLRCTWTLATWLWPIPAAIIGLSWRRLDFDLQQQALLDGGYWRITMRQLAAPAMAALATTAVLAMQEFAVYEPTGISVVATEVRMVFESGQPGALTGAMPNFTGQFSAFPLSSQRANSAAALVTATPLLVVMAILALLVRSLLKRTDSSERIESGSVPSVLAAGWKSYLLVAVILLIVLVIPMAALVASIKRAFDAGRIWRTFSLPVLGTLAVAGAAALIAAGVSACGMIRRARGPLILGLCTFLIGGQMLAIAMIRLYNQPADSIAYFATHAVYNGPAIVVMAYLARFGWLAVWASAWTWSPRWRELRELAAIDGASGLQTAWQVIGPLAWPLLLAAGVLIMLLAMTEVSATILLNPVRPKMFVSELMTWVHTLRSDDMLEGSLLLATIVIALSLIGIVLVAILRKRWMGGAAGRVSRLLIGGLLILQLTGCKKSAEPEAIWLETGAGEGQVVYPRAVCYDKSDDSFYVCDRLARIQHLDKSGKFISGFRMPAWSQGKPVGMSVGSDGNLWVPDTHYSRIIVMSPKGDVIKQFGKQGKGPGEFIYPSDIAFDSKGRVYISEFGDNDRVQVFDKDLNFLHAFGTFGDGDGQFSRPQSLLILNENGVEMLYVTDACNHRISVWTIDGRFVRNMGRIGSGLGEFRFPYGLDVDSKGRLVVCEFGNNRVQLIDRQTGQGLATWGSAGRDPGQMAYPWGVVVDKHDRVIAVDAGNNRLQVFEF